MEVVVQEIMQDKIYLDTAGNLAINEDGSPVESAVTDDAGPTLDDL